MNIAFPLRFDPRGRTAAADDGQHVRDLIEQVLFTAPGERVNRPAFGAGVRQLLFAPNSPELAATTQFILQGSLQQWIGNLAEILNVAVEARDSTLQITIEFRTRQGALPQAASFTVGGTLP